MGKEPHRAQVSGRVQVRHEPLRDTTGPLAPWHRTILHTSSHGRETMRLPGTYHVGLTPGVAKAHLEGAWLRDVPFPWTPQIPASVLCADPRIGGLMEQG